MVPLDIVWPNVGANAVQCNLQGNNQIGFSQIAALAVDNSQCGSDVRFIFPDSGFSVTAPAGDTGGVLPVFTNALDFYVQILNPLPNGFGADETIIEVLNTLPPIVAPSTPSNRVAAAENSLPLINGDNPVIDLGSAQASGTLRAMSLLFQLANATGSDTFALVQLRDITTAILWETFITAPANSSQLLAVNLSDLSVRFASAVSLVVSSSSIINSFANVNLYYSTP